MKSNLEGGSVYCHCEAWSDEAISVGGMVCRDCFAEFILSEILRSLRFLKMTRAKGLQ